MQTNSAMTAPHVCSFAYKFTGKERDAESGLDNFGPRYFGSSMGRFMSPDPIYVATPRLSDPQQWNLYSYARNNPLAITDSTGMDINLDCSGAGQMACENILGQFNKRKGAQFTIGRNADTGHLTASGDGSNLSGREAELYHAITDGDYTSTLKVVSSDPSFIGDHFVPGGGYNVVDASDLNAFGKANDAIPGEILAHAGIEGFESLAQFGSLKGQDQFDASHAFANKFFGDVTESNVTALGSGLNASGAAATYNFGKLGSSVDVYLRFQTPQPKASLPPLLGNMRGTIDHVSPTKPVVP